MSSGRSSNGSRKQSRLLSERAPAGLYVTSLDGVLLECNEVFAAMLGYPTCDDALAARMPLPGGSAPGSKRVHRKAQPATAVETCLTRRDGAAIRVLRTENVTEAKGEQVVVGALVDVTRTRTTEGHRIELEEQLRQLHKMEAVGRLAGGIAHDYNNLLAIILNYSSLVIDELDEQSPLRKDLAEIHRAAQRAAALTRQLLTMSRKGPTRPVVLDLRTLVAAMEEPLRCAVGADVELSLSLGTSACRVLAEAAQLEQVVMNVALNARDAMPGGGRLTIEARTVSIAAAGRTREEHPTLAPGRYARLAVSDTGSGMTDHVRTRAFDPFFTTKPTGKGTGLGLATVYGIVKQSRGHVEISSRPGEGTRVEIYLPSSPRRSPDGHAQKALKAPRSGAGATVLITDDEDAVLMLASRILSQSGYRTLTARGPHEALRVSKRQKGRIDLLLTDVLMPGINGKQLADRLLARRPDMKVLFMSGYAGDALADGGATCAAAALIEKPFTAESLLGYVQHLLGPTASRRA